MEGANFSCWSTWSGGSNGQSQQMVQDSKYGMRQSDFKQISVIGACMTFTNWITWASSRWNDVWGWVRNGVNRNEFISSDTWNSFKKNLDIPLYSAWTGYIRRKNYSKWSIMDDDPYFGDFLGPKFPSFHMEGSGRKYFGKSIVRVIKCRTCKRFSYLVVFPVIWKLIFVRVFQMIFRDLGVMTSRSFC